MIPVGKLLLAGLASVTVFGVWKFSQFVHHVFTSRIRHLRGPKGTSWVYGNLREIVKAENSALHEEWVKQYGNTFTYKGLFCTNGLFTMDTWAINHILANSSDYQMAPQVREILSQILGEGLLVVEGAQHRQQRHIMNPAFGPAQIRGLTDIFHSKVVQLRDVWLSEIAENSTGTATVNVMAWLSKMTLDVIGLAGFNYEFGALNVNEKPNELNEAFTAMISTGQRLGILPILQAWFPPFRLIPSDRVRRVQVARRTMARIGKELVSDAKAAARATATKEGEIEKSSLRSRDLLSLLIKANMATDIPESRRMSDEDVLAQIPTFLVAGHETTSTATTWAFYAMAQAPEIQTKLREELLSVETETPSMDELMALPYLDAVVRETLRVHSPIPTAERIAMKDDVLPVERPYTDKYGVIHDSISIKKGDPIIIPILALNRSQELWGPDAHEFKPERWQSIPDAVPRIPGVWGHLLTFLGGPKACIGYRFSLVEMKAFIFTLVRAFEFELAVPASEIVQKSTILQRPVLRSDPNRRPQLPLLLKPYQRSEVVDSRCKMNQGVVVCT